MHLRELAMALTKLGKYIEQCELKNTDDKYSEDSVVGISTQKMMISTKADLIDVKLTSYKLVPPKHFTYVPDTSRRGDKMSLCYNNTEKTYIVSSISIVFYVNNTKELNPEYLFMYFNRPEFDRYSRFNSWGSARETFDWSDMCDIDIDLPSIEIQQRYVDIYNAMLANQKSYERGLDDLKLVCDAYIEGLRRKIPCEPIGPYIESITESNINKGYKMVQGVESSGSFIDTRANMQGVDISNYTIVRKNNIAYNPSRINLGSIALYNDNEPCIVSPMYSVFKVVDTEKIIPEYLMLWFGRKEFHRYTWYYAAGSVRDTFDFNLMQEVKIPLPKREKQQDIVNIYSVYNTRRAINERLKTLIKDICPILIKGSIEEARRGENVHTAV